MGEPAATPRAAQQRVDELSAELRAAQAERDKVLASWYRGELERTRHAYGLLPRFAELAGVPGRIEMVRKAIKRGMGTL